MKRVEQLQQHLETSSGGALPGRYRSRICCGVWPPSLAGAAAGAAPCGQGCPAAGAGGGKSEERGGGEEEREGMSDMNRDSGSSAAARTAGTCCDERGIP